MKNIIASATLKNIKVSPRKAMLVADVVRGRRVYNVISFLENTRKAVNPQLTQLIKSAVANAQQNDKDVDVDKLMLKIIKVDKGFVLKRMRPFLLFQFLSLINQQSEFFLTKIYESLHPH